MGDTLSKLFEVGWRGPGGTWVLVLQHHTSYVNLLLLRGCWSLISRSFGEMPFLAFSSGVQVVGEGQLNLTPGLRWLLPLSFFSEAFLISCSQLERQ